MLETGLCANVAGCNRDSAELGALPGLFRFFVECGEV